MTSTQVDIGARVPRMRWTDLIGTRPAAFFACLLAWTLTNADQALFGYAVPGILEEFKLPLETVGVILTVSFLVSAVVVVFAGMAADRWGRGGTLAILLAVSAALVGAQGFASGIVELTVLRALGFGFSGGLAAITNAIVMENATPRYRGVALGLLQCGYPLGWLLASLGAAPLLALHGWRATCFIAFAVVPFALPLFLMLRQRAAPLRLAVTAPAAPGRRGGWRNTAVPPSPRRRSSSCSVVPTPARRSSSRPSSRSSAATRLRRRRHWSASRTASRSSAT